MHSYLTVINGTSTPNGGTSAASPVVAAIMTLLNDARFREGKPAIGFANPWLYGYAYKALNDITHGAAVGCTGTDLQNGLKIPGAGVIPYASWNATVGVSSPLHVVCDRLLLTCLQWDPVTGLGTPNFQELKDLACNSGSWGSS